MNRAERIARTHPYNRPLLPRHIALSQMGVSKGAVCTNWVKLQISVENCVAMNSRTISDEIGACRGDQFKLKPIRHYVGESIEAFANDTKGLEALARSGCHRMHFHIRRLHIRRLTSLSDSGTDAGRRMVAIAGSILGKRPSVRSSAV